MCFSLGAFTARDCNRRLVFPIPGFGIEDIGIVIPIYSARTAVYEVKFSSVELMCCEHMISGDQSLVISPYTDCLTAAFERRG